MPTMPTNSTYARRIIVALIALPLFEFLGGLVVVATGADDKRLHPTSPVLLLIIATLVTEAFLIPILLYLSRSWTTKKELLGFGKISSETAVKSLAMALGVLILGNMIIALIEALIGHHVTGSNRTTNLLNQGSGTGLERYVVLLFIAPFIVPIFEETIFRGIILNLLRKARNKTAEVSSAKGLLMGEPIPIIISALIFSAAHISGESLNDTLGLVLIFLMGLVNGRARIKYNSLLPGYLTHMAYNLIVGLLLITSTAH